MDRLTFNVTNSLRQDIEGPVPVSASADKTTVSVGEAIRFTIIANDESGLSGGNMRIVREGQQQWLNYELTVRSGTTNTVQHTFTPTADTAPGVYTLESFSVYDDAPYRNGNYYSVHADPGYFESPAPLPDSYKFSFTVVNPGYSQAQDPRVTQVSFSSSSVLPGDSVSIEVTVDDGGTVLEDYMYLRINKSDENGNVNQIGGTNLNLASDGKYKGTYRVPAVYQQRTLTVGYNIYHKNGYSTQYSALDDTTYSAPALTVGSVYSGTEDTSVLLGSSFDPMSGVTAANETEGSLNSRIRLEGEVDTQTVGIYLLKYKASSDLQFVPHQEEDPNGNYFSSRLVGVTETEPSGYSSDEEEPLVVTEDSIFVGADPEDVVIEKDGIPVGFSDELTAEGVYEITDVSGEQNADTGLWRYTSLPVTFLSAHSFSMSGVSVIRTAAVSAGRSSIVLIDRSAPVVSQIVTQTSSSAVSVQLKISDLSPVSKILYMSGKQEKSTVEKSGVSVKSNYKFTAAAGDKFSVLATDSLGHTSFTVLPVNQAASVSSVDPGVSGDPGSSEYSGNSEYSGASEASVVSEDPGVSGETSGGSSHEPDGSSVGQSGTDSGSIGSSGSYASQVPDEDRKSALPVILIIVAVLAAGGAGVGVYFLRRKRAEKID